jgi:predicted ATPase/DNA-binding CsgD family transcriptional regulator
MSIEHPATERDSLSKRAIEILRLLAEGYSDRDIAERLIMSVNTIKWYNRQIYSILGVGSRTQAIARAHELQLIGDDTDGFQIATPEQPLAARHSLPVETTRFIGRRHELDAISRLLNRTRLLTLVGPPGTGKTRLSLRVGWHSIGAFRDGVHFISLAPIHDPAQVIYAIAAPFGIQERHGQPLIETLKHALREQHVLLILDNFEHLLAVAPLVSELLAVAPHLKVLATSRESLHLYGEQVFSVPPLELPLPDVVDLEALVACEATALFVQQAQAVQADFALTEENAEAIAKICVRLEGLPLAIELAAARIKLLTPALLLARLNSRLDLLTGGAKDLPVRQRTLRNTLEWSYNLLSAGEKHLFARLAVFSGSSSLEAIEAVCEQGLSVDVFEGITSLVDKSLLHQVDVLANEPRFAMLETVREYAQQCLGESGEHTIMQQRHAAYFVTLAERAAPELRRSGFTEWMGRLESEATNLPVALDWLLESGDFETGIHMIATLRDFWVMSSRFVQGRIWSQRALAHLEAVSPVLRVRVLTTAGILLYYSSGHQSRQKTLLDEAIDLARALGDKRQLAWALMFRGTASIGQADEYESGLARAEEGLALFRALDDKPGIAQALNSIGELVRVHGDDQRAEAVYEECLRVVRETGEKRREAMALNNLGVVMMRRGEVQRARDLFKIALTKRLKVKHDKRGALTNVLFLAGALAAMGEPERAARLFGAVDALLRPMGVDLEPGDQPEFARDLARVQANLGMQVFDQCWEEGRTMSWDDMVVCALGEQGVT